MKYLIFLVSIIGLVACGTSSSGATEGVAVPRAPAQAVRAQPAPAEAIATDVILFENVPTTTFTHLSQGFAIDYPANWQLFEQADGVVFIDPTNRAGYSVFFSQTDAVLTVEQLNQAALTFVEDNFGDEADFEILQQENGLIQFKGTDPNIGEAVNELSIVQFQDLLFLILTSVVEDKWAETADGLRALRGSLTFTEAAAVPTVPPAPPEWLLYAHPTERFAFLYPSTWVLAEMETSVEVSEPESQFIFLVESIADLADVTDPAAIEDYVQALVDQSAGQFESFEALPVTAYQTESTVGYTTDFLYVNDQGESIAGSYIVTGIDGKFFRVTITAPALAYEAALVWFNPMLQSFRLVNEE